MRIFAVMKKSLITSLCVALIALCCVGCGGRAKRQGESSAVKAPRVFVPAIIPSSIVEPEARRVYMCEHYWDKLNLADSTFFA